MQRMDKMGSVQAHGVATSAYLGDQSQNTVRGQTGAWKFFFKVSLPS